MKKNTRILLITGLVLTIVPPAIGMILTVLSMMAAFQDLAGHGVANPTQLANHIGGVLTYTAAGLGLSGIGIVILLITGALCWSQRGGARSGA